jgi:hypothetical protein
MPVAPKPVNVLVSGFNHHAYIVRGLASLVCGRISVGSGLALAAWGAFLGQHKTSKQTVHSLFWPINRAFAELNELFRQT